MGNLMSEIRTADSIRQALPTISGIVNHGSGFVVQTLQARKQELIGIQNAFYALEQQAYGKMGVTNLQQLQIKVDEINASGLGSLSAKASSAFQVVKDASVAGYSEEEISQAISQFFSEGKFLDGSSVPGMTQTLQDWTLETAFESLASGIQSQRNMRMTKSAKVSVSSLKSKFTIDGKNVKMNGKNSKKALGGYKKDIVCFLGLQSHTPQSLQFEITAQTQETKQNNNLNYYPYFVSGTPLSQEQLNDKSVWSIFKQKIKNLAPAYSAQIEQVMEEMQPPAFIASNANEIKGILGELQMLVILTVLGNGAKATYTGDMRNKLRNNAKIGIDALLGDIGFQVKNYSGYFAGDQVQGINLSHNWTLDYFLDKIEELPITEIGTFYALKSYHTQTDPSFGDVISNFGAIEAGLKKTYLGFIDRFFSFQEEVAMGENLQSITMRNLFWFVSGKYIIPTSRIIGAYIKRINAVIKQTQGNSGLAVNSSYNGPTYKDYVKDNKNKEMPSLEEIQNQIHMKITLNLHFPNLISDIMNSNF